MATFEIEQYEIHVMRYRIEAETEAQAIDGLLQGEADTVDQSQEYIEVCDTMGMPTTPELAAQLNDLGVPVDDIVPSVRSITKL
jgi:hypothetical protein